MSNTTAGSGDHQAALALNHAHSQRTFALLVFGFSFALLLLVSVVTLWSRAFSAEMVFTTITTLVGTWVGTLLAFFYSRENFESASRSMQQTINRLSPDERLQTISAESAMKPLKNIVYLAEKDLDKIPLTTIKKKFDDNPTVTRLPIFNEDLSAFAILHEGTLDKYREAHKDKPNATLGDLLTDPDGARAKVLLFLNRQQTLRDAHAAIQLIRDAKDVFVTATGAGKEPVLGWITDTDVIEKMHA